MVSPEVLEKFGTTRKRLREIFEKVPYTDPGPDATDEERKAYQGALLDEKVRNQFESEISNITQEGVAWGLKNYQLYAAVDVAWDTPALTREMIPLLLYAQSKITIQTCTTQLAGLNCADQFVRKDAAGTAVGIDMPKFVETSLNMVRSYVTRRHAAQSVKYTNLYPYYKYESRRTDMAGKLRADAMSQEAEIIVDDFDYRHHDSQVMRDALLYGHSVDFVRSPWDVVRQYQADETAKEFKTYTKEDPRTLPVKSYIEKEGVSWVNPHPTRLICDNSEPLAAINSDTGPLYIGYWDIVRYGAVSKNPDYFNRTAITYGMTGLWGLYSKYTDYFQQYFCNIQMPAGPAPVPNPMGPFAGAAAATVDPGGANDRKASIGLYSGDMDHMSMFKVEYFRKLIPANHRMGEYPFEIWVRFVLASDSTIIFAEPMPSTPAAYCGINESDSRQVNASFAHDVMWAQDLMSNLVTQMMLAVEGELFKVIGINTDMIDAEDVKRIEDRLKGRDWSARGPLVIPFSVKALAEELDLKLDAVFKLGETRQGQSVEVIFRAMTQLLALLERMTAMSPAEQGQPAPREISATEVTEIASTTQNVYSFISDGIDEFRAAKKRILYESAACCKEGKVQVPVVNRYSKKTITAAGFTVANPEEGEEVERPQRVTLIGTRKELRHAYVFTTRDGAERPVNTQAANSLVQLMQVVLQVPPVLQALGREKIFDIFNEIFRLSGTGVDLLLEMQEGDDKGFGADQIAQMQQVLQQLQGALQQIAQATQKNAQDIAGQESINQQQQGLLDGVGQALELVKKSALDINQLFKRLDGIDKQETPPEIPYISAPEEVRRQIEKRAGFMPPPAPTYLEEELLKEKQKRNGQTTVTT